jgi:hypothetical protein
LGDTGMDVGVFATWPHLSRLGGRFIPCSRIPVLAVTSFSYSDGCSGAECISRQSVIRGVTDSATECPDDGENGLNARRAILARSRMG